MIYKTKKIPVKCSKADYKYLLGLNNLSAQCWNCCVEIDKKHYESTGKYMTMKELQCATKGCVPLHSKGICHVYLKYLSARISMFRSIAAKHENSNKVKLPYKQKKYYPTGWDYQCIKVDYDKGLILLARPMDKENRKKRPPVKCYVKSIPQSIVEIELIYRNGLYLAIKYKEENLAEEIEGMNVAAIDLGEIHSITSIDDNGNAIIITGRKLRSIKRLQEKEGAKIRSFRSRCQKGSRQYRKYSRALYKLKLKSDKQILDCVHKISKLYLDYCLNNNIGRVYYGDIDSATRDTKGRVGRMTGQKLNDWCHGKLMLQLHNKLERYGIELVKTSEAYTSQTCPNCGKRHKPSGRNYICSCGYQQHRDVVGAMNILNFNEGTQITKYEDLKYLRIA